MAVTIGHTDSSNTASVGDLDSVKFIDSCCNNQSKEVSEVYSYDQYILHRRNECDLKLKCPNECSGCESSHFYPKTFSSLATLRKHLESECPKSSFSCLNCECQLQRENINGKHDEAACLEYLYQKYAKVK